MFVIKNDHIHQVQIKQESPKQSQLQVIELSPVFKQKPQTVVIRNMPKNKSHSHQCPDTLMLELQASMEYLSDSIFDGISSIRKTTQNKVYIGIVEDQDQYLKRFFNADHNSRPYVKQFIAEVSDNVQSMIMDEILHGNHNIKKTNKFTKDDIYGHKATETAIRIRQQLLKAKISEFKNDLTSNRTNLSVIQIFNPYNSDLYGVKSERTKQAASFVKKMKKQQQYIKDNYRRIKQNEKYKRKQDQEQKQQIQLQLKQERHQFLKRQFEQKRKEKERLQEENSQKQQQFRQYYKEHLKNQPLFKQKQEQFFKKVILPENKRKMQLLKQIKQDHQPLSKEQLNEHQQYYLQIKDDHMYERNAERVMDRQLWKKSKGFYKSKFYSSIDQQKNKKQPNEIEQKNKLYSKRWEYANDIKTKFMPATSPKKLKQSNKRRSLDMGEKKKNASSDSTRKDGQHNLDQLHKYMAQLKAQGRVRYGSTSHTIQHEVKPVYKNYLRESRVTRSRLVHSIDYSTLAGKDTDKLKFDLKKKQEDSARREQHLIHVGTKDMDHYMSEKKKLDEDYLESARAKMAILNKFQ